MRAEAAVRGHAGLYALPAAVMVLVTVDVLLDGPLRRLDWTVHEFCDAHVRGGLLTAVHLVTKLGQRGDLVVVIVPLAVIASVRTRSPRCLLVSVVIVGGLSLLQTGLKAAIPRTYPFSGTDVLFAHGNAYPSGHTLNAFVLIWLILELLVIAFPSVRLPAHRRRGIALAAGCVTAAALTVADEHWLTDVLFSLALGPVLLSLLIRWRPLTREGGRRRSR
ncbi:phosphatase PAP2 family protein [Actinomadura sp. NAK00032]|uniref:phosphatase PAP2 family protein n=1 Tax=Actinomadura sp. NAK00032 TaxID=2742128 RepID=UPI0015915B1B|nr:phosphatase PAP2 family protein [Actinomadura sp. NAK00032]QKW34688.1 phosphatase PAP2 family protein [Actinomadura sp. NAK00032]